MENQAFNFTSAPENRCALPTVGLVITYEKSLKQLLVICPDGTQTTYPLVVEGTPQTHALYLSTGSPRQMQVGAVDFLGNPLVTFEIPLNAGSFSLEFDDEGVMEHIGSLDIRDIGRVQAHGTTTINFSVVPIELCVVGNLLIIKTLYQNDAFGLGVWYTFTPTQP